MMRAKNILRGLKHLIRSGDWVVEGSFFKLNLIIQFLMSRECFDKRRKGLMGCLPKIVKTNYAVHKGPFMSFLFRGGGQSFSFLLFDEHLIA